MSKSTNVQPWSQLRSQEPQNQRSARPRTLSPKRLRSTQGRRRQLERDAAGRQNRMVASLPSERLYIHPAHGQSSIIEWDQGGGIAIDESRCPRPPRVAQNPAKTVRYEPARTASRASTRECLEGDRSRPCLATRSRSAASKEARAISSKAPGSGRRGGRGGDVTGPPWVGLIVAPSSIVTGGKLRDCRRHGRDCQDALHE